MPPLTPQQAFDLAVDSVHSGRLDEARGLCRQLLAIYPDNARTLYVLGLAARQSGELGDAVQWFQRAIAAGPAEGTFYNDLGDALHTQGQFEEAVSAYRRALELQPASAAIHNNLGNALKALGRPEEALAAYRQALALARDIAEIHSNCAGVLQELGRTIEAIAAARHALALKPGFAMAHNNLGQALLSHGEAPAAMEAFGRALALEPNLAVAHNNLGSALKTLGREDEARAAYERAVEADPHYPLGLANLASALYQLGQLDDAIRLDRRATAAADAPPSVLDNLLAILHFLPDVTLPGLRQAHDAYEQRYSEPLRAGWPRHPNTREPERSLRLGFVSPSFGIHPVGFFLAPLLENLDQRQFAVVCYHDSTRADAMTSRLKACATEWRPVRGLLDDAVARRIHEDRIDVLFDLAGHNAENRLPVFARKPAPVQITWLDYVGTTGLSAMDYILANAPQIPLEAEPHYREKVLRMPDDYICFDPPAEAPPVGPLPAAANGFVTFASFNVLPKINSEVVTLWSRILREISGARLILKNRRFDDPGISARYRQWFAANSVDPGRIVFQGWAARGELLAGYHEVDIALDPIPYNGGVTTCEALWMGVPVVTCPGETFASRHGLAHLSAVGATETIARDRDEYVKIAAALAGDIPRLTTLRAGLRQRMASSPLCDGPRFARNFEAVIREAWRRWCAGSD